MFKYRSIELPENQVANEIGYLMNLLGHSLVDLKNKLFQKQLVRRGCCVFPKCDWFVGYRRENSNF